jgi:hypothetical protein
VLYTYFDELQTWFARRGEAKLGAPGSLSGPTAAV